MGVTCADGLTTGAVVMATATPSADESADALTAATSAWTALRSRLEPAGAEMVTEMAEPVERRRRTGAAEGAKSSRRAGCAVPADDSSSDSRRPLPAGAVPSPLPPLTLTHPE